MFARGIQAALVANRTNYESEVGGFLERVWSRMKVLGLIDKDPYDSTTAGQLCGILIVAILKVFDPDIPSVLDPMVSL